MTTNNGEWVLVDNRALIRVEDISAVVIQNVLEGFEVHYKNCDGLSLHVSSFQDLDDAQHAIAEFMLSFQAEEVSTEAKMSLNDYMSWNSYNAPIYKTVTYQDNTI